MNISQNKNKVASILRIIALIPLIPSIFVMFVSVGFMIYFSSCVSVVNVEETWFWFLAPFYVLGGVVATISIAIRNDNNLQLKRRISAFFIIPSAYVVGFVLTIASSEGVVKGIGGTMLIYGQSTSFTEELKCHGSSRNKYLGDYNYLIDKNGNTYKVFDFGRICNPMWSRTDTKVVRATGRQNYFVKSFETLEVVYH